MRESIKGEVAISRDVWLALEIAHSDFADKLRHLLGAHELESAGSLVEALHALALECSDYASTCKELKKQVKKGRPKVVKPTPKEKTQNKLECALLPALYEYKSPTGRPVVYGAKYDRLTFKVVVERREELARTNKAKPTIKAAIDSLNAQRAMENSRREGAAIKDDFEKVHSAYKRGKRLLAEKSKPAT